MCVCNLFSLAFGLGLVHNGSVLELLPFVVGLGRVMLFCFRDVLCLFGFLVLIWTCLCFTLYLRVRGLCFVVYKRFGLIVCGFELGIEAFIGMYDVILFYLRLRGLSLLLAIDGWLFSYMSWTLALRCRPFDVWVFVGWVDPVLFDVFCFERRFCGVECLSAWFLFLFLSIFGCICVNLILLSFGLWGFIMQVMFC